MEIDVFVNSTETIIVESTLDQVNPLTAATKYAAIPINFIREFTKELYPTLMEIGVQDFHVAIESLRNAVDAASLQSIEREIDHCCLALKFAIKRFEEGGNKERDFRVGPFPAGQFRLSKQSKYYENAFETAFVLFILYLNMRDYSLAKSYLDRAMENFTHYARVRLLKGKANEFVDWKECPVVHKLAAQEAKLFKYIRDTDKIFYETNCFKVCKCEVSRHVCEAQHKVMDFEVWNPNFHEFDRLESYILSHHRQGGRA